MKLLMLLLFLLSLDGERVDVLEIDVGSNEGSGGRL